MTAIGTGQQWIEIPRWDEFQHRDMARSTVPPWVKNLTRLLSDEAYLTLTPHRRALLHGLWLEYARTRRQLPDNTASISRRLAMKVTTSDLKALNHAGFVLFSASNPASNQASKDAGNPAGLEVEVEREGSSKTPSSARAKPNSRGEAFAIRTLIANGAITDLVDLEAELRAHPALTDDERDHLRQTLPSSNPPTQAPTVDLAKAIIDEARAAALAGRPWLDVEADLQARAAETSDATALIDAAGDAYQAARHPEPMETT